MTQRNQKPPEHQDRILPRDLRAELGVLGSVLLLHDRPSAIDKVLSIVSREDFYDDANARLFGAIASHHVSGKRMDVTLLESRLKDAGDWDLIGGGEYFRKVWNSEPNGAHAVYYAEIVSRKALARRLIHRCTDLLTESYDSDDPESVVRMMQSACHALTETSGQRFSKPRLISEVADEVMRRIESPEDQSNVARAWWGLYAVDSRLGPFLGGEVVVAAARPGAGKTAFACHVLHHSALHDRPALLVSLEMTDGEITGRDLARLGDVDGRKIRSGQLNADDVASLRNAQRSMAGLPVWLWSPYTATLAEIRGMVHRMIADHGIKLVAIDYLSLIEPAREWRDMKRHDQVGEISRGLHRLAREVSLPFVVLQQLNRDADGQEPSLRHLAESGAIERDADLVVFLHGGHGAQRRVSERKYAPVPVDERDLIVAKFRAGPAQKITVGWDGKRTAFKDLEGSVPPPEEQGPQQGTIF